jgi:hypothetical protein
MASFFSFPLCLSRNILKDNKYITKFVPNKVEYFADAARSFDGVL